MGMPQVVPATGALLQQVLDETFPLWGEGLDRAGYGRYNAAQLATPWGASHLHRVALVEGRDLLATAKVYRLRGALRRPGGGHGGPRRGVHAPRAPPAGSRRRT